MAAIAPRAAVPFKKERLDTELSSNGFKTLVSFPIISSIKLFSTTYIYALGIICKNNLMEDIMGKETNPPLNYFLLPIYMH